MAQPIVLLATLGTQPQVITAGVHLLRRSGTAVARVRVFHTHALTIRQGLQALERVFLQHRLPPLERLPLHNEQGHPLEDVLTEAHMHNVFRIFYRVLDNHKRQGEVVHFLLAGGRKPLALFAMAAAQLLFDEQDRLWHLYSEPRFLESRAWFPHPEDDVRLVPIPLIPWHCMAPATAVLGPVADPWQAVNQARDWGLKARIHRARRFVEAELTSAERQVTALLVREGLGTRELARRLHMSEKTIHNHLNRVYQKAAVFWQLERVQRAQLVALLQPYFLHQPELGVFSHDAGV